MYERETAIQADLHGYLHRRADSNSVHSRGEAIRLASDFKLQLEEIRVLEEKISADYHAKPHLVPLYCAVHFTGHSFPLIERDNWFIYRLQEATHSAALVHTLQDRYPFAQVFNPRYPLVVAPPASPRDKPGTPGAAPAASGSGAHAGAGAGAGDTAGFASTAGGDGPGVSAASRGSMRFMGVPADPTSPIDDHIYVYPAVLVSAGVVQKEVVDRHGNVQEVSTPGSRFRVWVSRTAAEVGVTTLNKMAAAATLRGLSPHHRGSRAPRGRGQKVDLEADAGDSEPPATFVVSDLGPCLLNECVPSVKCPELPHPLPWRKVVRAVSLTVSAGGGAGQVRQEGEPRRVVGPRAHVACLCDRPVHREPTDHQRAQRPVPRRVGAQRCQVRARDVPVPVGV